jgi:uncharacterized protein (TIGR02996 family)
MMTPDNPFLRALLAQPDDDTLRLAMADWLDENDEAPRAEFIRTQCELAQGVEDLDHRRQLELRQRALLIAHEAEWVQPLADVLDCKPGQWGGWVFRRGFAEYFHLPAAAINLRGTRLVQLTPVRELFLRPCNSANVVSLSKKPWLRSVTALYLRAARLNANAVRALIESPYLQSLRVLDAVAGDDVTEAVAKDFHRRFARHLVRSPHD